MTELESRIIALRLANKSMKLIAKELDCSISTVSWHAKKHGLDGIAASRRKTLSDDEFIATVSQSVLNEINELWSKQSGTLKKIASQVGLPLDKVKRISRINGWNRSLSFISKKQEIVDSLARNNGDYKAVMAELGVSRTTVYEYGGKSSRIVQTKEERKKSMVGHVNNCRRKRRLDLIEYKGGKCAACGYNKCVRSLAFHHINPEEKDFTLGGRAYSLEVMKREVDKCVLVCANCHGEIHEQIDIVGYSDIVNSITSVA